MTTVTVRLKGGYFELKDALVSACRHYSTHKLTDGFATLTYICETINAEAAIAGVQDDINIDALEGLGIEVLEIAA